MSTFMGRLEKGQGRSDDREHHYNKRIAKEVESVLGAAIADYRAGFTGRVRVQAKGEILGDFVALARQALVEHHDDADRVAAVLTAAALEETLKQLGECAGLDVYNRDMRGVIQKLKNEGALVGAQAGVAFGYAGFRDSAFHGQFQDIERAATESALTFVEGLLSSEFS